MQGQSIEKLFGQFLIKQKGYPETSLLFEAHINTETNANKFTRYFADLLIIDTDYSNYLALVEFKASRERKFFDEGIRQIRNTLFKLKKPELPAYLVRPNGNDFEIFTVSNGELNKIEKDDFPHYQTLQSKIKADSKSQIEELEKLAYKEAKKKKELLTSTAISTLLSLSAGILAVILFSQNIIDYHGKSPAETGFYKDSTLKVLNGVTNRIQELETKLEKVQKNDSSFKNYSRDQKMIEIEDRLKNFESAITSAPDRILRLQELNFELKNLQNSIQKEKEISEAKLASVKEKTDQINIYTSGIIIALVGSIIGFAINAFIKR